MYSQENVPDYFFRLQLSQGHFKKTNLWLTTDNIPLGELSVFTACRLPPQHVYTLPLGLLLFNDSSHLADGDSVRFHQQLNHHLKWKRI